MGYGSDDRDDNRWRDRGERGGWRGEGRGPGGHGRDDDRGFFDRAGDQVRSWFGDDEAQRRREMDERRWEQEARMSGGRDRDPRSGGSGWTGGGWGNQPGESWHRDEGFGNDRVARGGPGFGGHPDQGRSFDRNDPGRVGTSGPMSQRFSGYGGGDQLTRGGDIHDPHYSEWRRRQMDELDRDYDEYRREHQSKFEAEFGGWRQKRASQRELLGRVTEHMEVVGSDGSHVGKVDKVRGDRIILAKSDPKAGGMHHSVPCGWVESVEDKVILSRTAGSAMEAWRNEDNGRALFEREDQGSEGPHALDRSFSGTYGGRNDD
jgi:hypothetical protein